MSTLKNHVQLIGNVGQEPTITNLESGKKVARFQSQQTSITRMPKAKSKRTPIGTR